MLGTVFLASQLVRHVRDKFNKVISRYVPVKLHTACATFLTRTGDTIFATSPCGTRGKEKTGFGQRMAVGFIIGERYASTVVQAKAGALVKRRDAHEGFNEVVPVDLALLVVNETVKEEALGKGKGQGDEYEVGCESSHV